MSSLFHKLVERHADSGKSSLQPRIPSRFEATQVRSDSYAIDHGLEPETQVRPSFSMPVTQAQHPFPTERVAHEPSKIDSPTANPSTSLDVDPNWQRRLIAAEDALKSLERPLDRDMPHPPSFTSNTADVALPSLNRQAGGLVETVHSHHHHYDPVPDGPIERPAPRIALSDEPTERKPPQKSSFQFDPLEAVLTRAPIVPVNVAHSSDESSRTSPKLSESIVPQRAAITPKPLIEPRAVTRESRPNAAIGTVFDFEREHLTPQPPIDHWQTAMPETRAPRLFAQTAALPQKHTAPPTIVTDVAPRQSEPSTTVHVSIGRILVRSSSPKTEPIRQPAQNASSRVMTLEQYARHRSGGNR